MEVLVTKPRRYTRYFVKDCCKTQYGAYTAVGIMAAYIVLDGVDEATINVFIHVTKQVPKVEDSTDGPNIHINAARLCSRLHERVNR